MKVSKRLETIASLVKSNKRVIDIGCDHGLLGIYLYLENNNKVILSDINEKCINVAKKNLEKYNLSNNIQVIISDGLNNIDIKKDDIAIIAGMGTNTIANILKNPKTELLSEIIIQTNNDYEELRKLVVNMGYVIDDEIYLIDKNIEYVIIKFIKGKKKYSKIEYLIGPRLLQNKYYLSNIIKHYEMILNKLPKKYILKRLKIKILLKKLTIKQRKLGY